MKPKLLLISYMIALCSCHLKQQNNSDSTTDTITFNDGAPHRNGTDIEIKAKMVIQPVADVTYPNAKAGEDAPDVVKIDADRIERIINGTCIIQKGNVEALIDFKGNFIVPWGKYDFQDEYADRMLFYPLLLVKEHGRAGFINVKGEVVFPCLSLNDFRQFNAYGIAQLNNKAVDVNGNTLGIKGTPETINELPNRNLYNQPQFTAAIPVREGFEIVDGNTHKGGEATAYEDTDGKHVFPMVRYGGFFTEGLAPYQMLTNLKTCYGATSIPKAMWQYRQHSPLDRITSTMALH